MRSRRHLALALGALVGAGMLPAQTAAGPGYAAGTNRYRVTTVVERSQFTGGDREPFGFEVTTRQLVTVALQPLAPDTLRFTVRLDSVSVTSTLAAPQPDTRHLVGQTLTGTISPQGRIYRFEPPAGTTEADVVALYGAFRRFLPLLPPAPLAAGRAWADTSADRTRRGGFDVLTRTMASSRVSGDTAVAGRPAWRIEHRVQIAQEGEGREREQPVMLEGDGSVNGVQVVSRDGVFLGSQSTQRVELLIRMPDSESPPITQTIRSTVELVPGA